MPSPWPEPIAIVSAACRLPSADSPDAFWDVLSAGQPIVSSAPNRRWNTNIPAGSGPRAAFLSDSQLEDFDAAFFGLSDAEVADMDPHQRLMLSVGAEAVKGAGDRYWDANMRCVKDENSTMGVFVGVGVGAADAATVALQNPPTVHTNFGYLPFSIANRLSHALNLRGPSLTIDTACSASLTAVHYACQALHSGDCDWALAAGVNLITNPSSFAHIGALRILSPKYHSPIFTPDVDGYTRGEGCIAIVLKKLSDAEKDGDRILGVIRGSAGGHNGRTGRMMATPSVGCARRTRRGGLLTRSSLPFRWKVNLESFAKLCNELAWNRTTSTTLKRG